MSLCIILWGLDCCSSAILLGRFIARHRFLYRSGGWLAPIEWRGLSLFSCNLHFFFLSSLLREQVVEAGSSPCTGRQCCCPVQRCAGAAAWPTCYLTCICPSSVCYLLAHDFCEAFCPISGNVVSCMNEGFAVREVFIRIPHGLCFLPWITFGVLHKYGMVPHRDTSA